MAINPGISGSHSEPVWPVNSSEALSPAPASAAPRGLLAGTQRPQGLLGGGPFPVNTLFEGLQPWASPEMIHGHMDTKNRQALLKGVSGWTLPGVGQIGTGESLVRANFPHLSEEQARQAITGQALIGGGVGGGAGASGSIEQQFPNSAGKFPLSPFQPIPAGLPFQQARDITSTGGLAQGAQGSDPSQALQALEWLRGKLATVKR